MISLPIMIVIFGVLVAGIILIVSMLNQRKAKKRHIHATILGQTSNQPSQKKEQALKSAEMERKLKEAAVGYKNNDPNKITLPLMIKQAGYDTPVARFWLYSFVFSAASAFGLLTLTSFSKPVIILFTFTALLGIPRLYLKWRSKKRQVAFLEEFAETLDAMSRLLKAGMPVTEAIAMAGREFQGPIGDEMSQIYENQKIGISLSDAVAESALRMPITEMKMFATAVGIQAETGSSLSEVLENLSAVIRSRFRLKRKVVALSQEAKSSATIIGALPILVGGGMNLIQPEYTGILLEKPLLLWACAIWMSIGVLVMRQMINFKV